MNSPCVKYPPTLTPHATSQTQTQTESPYKDLEPVHNELQTENTILKKLFKIMKMSYKIPEHILDTHKKLILSKRLLKEFIALLIKVNETDVIIYSRAQADGGCCGFKVIIEEITEIKKNVVTYIKVWKYVTMKFTIEYLKNLEYHCKK